MKIIAKSKQLLSVSIKQDDDVVIFADSLRMVIKHNDVGISVDYYRRGEEEPFREAQIWFDE